MQQATQLTNRPPGRIRPRLWAILLSVVLIGTTTWNALALDSPTPKSHKELTFHDWKLTARITAVPLRQVLDEVGRLSGVHIRWTNAGGADPISMEFIALPLADALARLLAGQNFMLFYAAASEERLTQVWISSRGGQEEHLSFPFPAGAESEVAPYGEEGPLVDRTPPFEHLPRATMEPGDPASDLGMIELLGR